MSDSTQRKSDSKKRLEAIQRISKNLSEKRKEALATSIDDTAKDITASSSTNQPLANKIANSITPIMEKSIKTFEPIIRNASELAQGVLVDVVDIGNDIVNDSDDILKDTTGISPEKIVLDTFDELGITKENIEHINNALESDEFKEDFKNHIDILAITTADILKSPNFAETSDVVIDESKEIASKSFKAAVQVFLNGLEEIFPLGPIIALARSANTVGSTAVDNLEHAGNISNMSSELVALSSDVYIKKLKQLKDTKEKLQRYKEKLKRSQEKIQRTKDKFVNSDKPSFNNLKDTKTKSVEGTKKGGTKKGGTKKVGTKKGGTKKGDTKVESDLDTLKYNATKLAANTSQLAKEIKDMESVDNLKQILMNQSKTVGDKSFKASIEVLLNGLEEIFPFGPLLSLSRSGETISNNISDTIFHAKHIASEFYTISEKIKDKSKKTLEAVQNTQSKFINSDKPSIKDDKPTSVEGKKKGGKRKKKKKNIINPKKLDFFYKLFFHFK